MSEAAGSGALQAPAVPKRRARSKSVLSFLRRQSATFLVASAVLVVYVVVALTGRWWAPYSPDELLTGDPFAPPSRDHLLGTDNFGRDVFSRLVHGERLVLGLALATAGLSVILGSALGLISGCLRGWPDEILGRVLEILISIPPLILALLVLGSLGSSYVLTVSLVAFFFAIRVATVIRAAALDVVSDDFVTLARLRGESTWSIAVREVLPNVSSAVLVEFSLRTGYAVLFIGGLSFLGFGPAPPTPDWGLMINEGRTYISTAPWPVVGPALALAFLVVALSLFTERLSDILGFSAQRAPSQ